MKLNKTTAQNSFKYSWLLSRIWPYIKPVLPRIIIGFIIAIPLGLLDGVTAFALKPYMDYVVGKQDWIFHIFGKEYTLTWQLFAFLIPFGIVIFAGIQGLLRYFNGYISTWTSKKITNAVKIDLFNKLIYMDTKFFDENSSGIIMSRYLNDPQTAADGLIEQIKNITTSIFGALGLITVMLYSSWKLALVGVIILCIAFLPVMLIRNLIKQTSNQSMVINGQIRTYMNETYVGNRTMNSYQLQNRMKNLYNEQIKESFDVSMHLIKRSGWMSPMMYLIASIGVALVLAYGTNLITSGELTAGSFASFVTSLLLLYKPVKTLGNTLTSIQNIFVAMGRIFELYDLKPDVTSRPKAKEFKNLETEINIDNVSFQYLPDKLILKNINLTIPKNETLAIVGNSGGGKSTLVNLISRFYDVTSGSIKFDDVDIREYSLNSIRKNIAVVFQDNFLYSGTIRENIMMGNFDASEEEFQNAIKSAHLEDFLNTLQDGVDTEIGERGTTLSGGQRQRVAIARAILRDAPIIILDEATSALDNESEAIVQKAMDNLMKNKTVFVIAHRLSTIQNADKIVVINQGEIVEAGTHDELLSIENGAYKTLYEMQFKHQKSENKNGVI